MPVTGAQPTPRNFPNENRIPLVELGTYVATETIQVTVPIAKAGPAIDAGIGAGANETYGLTYDTTKREQLYRQAVESAVRSSRDEALAIARVAGVSLAGLESIAASGAPRVTEAGFMGAMRLATVPAPVSPGTDVITATVQVVYRIR